MRTQSLVTVIFVVAGTFCATSCGSSGGGSAAPTPIYPSIAGTWNGTLAGSSPATSADVHVVLEQSTELVGGGTVGASFLQKISGTWNGTDSDGQLAGNFTGGIDPRGRADFTLVTTGTDCNVSIDVTLTNGRLIGTYSIVGANGCRALPLTQTGAVSLSK